jgi:hypothetical protein
MGIALRVGAGRGNPPCSTVPWRCIPTQLATRQVGVASQLGPVAVALSASAIVDNSGALSARDSGPAD